MENVISYFSTIPSSHRAAILAGGIAFFWLAESIQPLFSFQYLKWKHAWINIFFTLTTIIVNFVLAFFLLSMANWSVANDFGFLNWLPKLNIWLYTLLGLLLLDLIAAWLAHFVQHKIKWMWRFHLIHHTDNSIDTTTANRHHPGESVIRFLFTVFAVCIIGSPMWMVFLYQSLSVIFSQFNHANISLPRRLDTFISYILVSPNMHKIHHHYVLPYTDSNYGNIFSIWDRIFGTFRFFHPAKLIYGVDTHMDERKNNNIKTLLKIPFEKHYTAHKTEAE